MLLTEFHQQEQDEYKKVSRTTPETFDELLALIQTDTAKERTLMRESMKKSVCSLNIFRFHSHADGYSDFP